MDKRAAVRRRLQADPRGCVPSKQVPASFVKPQGIERGMAGLPGDHDFGRAAGKRGRGESRPHTVCAILLPVKADAGGEFLHDLRDAVAEYRLAVWPVQHAAKECAGNRTTRVEPAAKRTNRACGCVLSVRYGDPSAVAFAVLLFVAHGHDDALPREPQVFGPQRRQRGTPQRRGEAKEQQRRVAGRDRRFVAETPNDALQVGGFERRFLGWHLRQDAPRSAQQALCAVAVWTREAGVLVGVLDREAVLLGGRNFPAVVDQVGDVQFQRIFGRRQRRAFGRLAPAAEQSEIGAVAGCCTRGESHVFEYGPFALNRRKIRWRESLEDVAGGRHSQIVWRYYPSSQSRDYDTSKSRPSNRVTRPPRPPPGLLL